MLALIINPVAFAKEKSRYLMDIVDVQGLRNNQLVGYGIVVGLDGTGDKNQVKFTSQSVTNMLKQFGVQLDGNNQPKVKNVAAVAVVATVPPLASPGQQIDVSVSSIGDAKSLRGGTLLMTPLKGIDGEVYAVAQGNVVVGGISASGRNGSSITVNVPTVGRIPNGALLENGIKSSFNKKPEVTLNLKTPSFTTARNIERSINSVFGPGVAEAINYAKVVVQAPKNDDQRVTFMSMLDDIQVQTGRQIPKVIFNSRTGTVVLGGDVIVHQAAVSHGNLTVTIKEKPKVSQPNGNILGNNNGRTVVTNNSRVNIKEENNHMFIWPAATKLSEIVNAVNSIGASPSDLMAILQALDAAGAIDAEFVVI